MEEKIKRIIEAYKDQDLIHIAVTCPELGVAIDRAYQKETEHHRINEMVRGGRGRVELVLHEMKDKYALLAELLADQLSLALVEKERELFKKIADYGENSILVTDERGHIRYVNYHFEKMTGYQLVEVIGENPNILRSGEQSDAFYQEMWQEIKAGRPWLGEFHNKRRDGSLFWERARILPLDLADETVYVAYKTDIALQKKIEETLILKNRHLADVLSELERTQTALRDQEGLEEVGDLAAGLSHELAIPLQVLRDRLETLQEEKDRVGERKAQSLLSEIDRALGYVEGVIRSFTSYTEGEREEGNTPYNLGEALDRVLSLLSPLIGDQVMVKVDMDEVTPFTCREVPMNRILFQVIENGLEAIGKKEEGGTLTIEVREDEDLAVRIRDDGVGIPQGDLARVFDPFYTTKEGTHRMGLGLHVTRHLVEKEMGGQIDVTSDQNQGTTVTICLPR